MKNMDNDLNSSSLVVALDTPESCEMSVGDERFSGWCFHPSCLILELKIKVGDVLTLCKYGYERKDVACSYSDIEYSEKSGFEAIVPLIPGKFQPIITALLDNGETVSCSTGKKLVVKPPSLLGLLIARIKKVAVFLSYAKERAEAWKASRGRYPSVRELPVLVAKTIFLFKSEQLGPDTIKCPPAGLKLPQKEDLYDSWLWCNKWNLRRQGALERKINEMDSKPLISILMPVYNPPIQFLEKAINSVIDQVYDRWELCIADDCSTDPKVREFLERAVKRDERIKAVFLLENVNISKATNAAASLAAGEYYAFLDNDDELAPDALAEIALYVYENPETDFLYSDDDKIDENGRRFAPQFKPEWSPELLLSYMYCSHLVVVSRMVFFLVGGCREGFEGSQDYDFALRVTEKARHIGHIPRILYHWRVLPGSTAQSGHAKPQSINSGLKAVRDAMERRKICCQVTQPKWATIGGYGIFELDFKDSGPLVSVIIPTKNSCRILKNCLDSLKKTTYKNFEVIIVDNDSDDPKTKSFLDTCNHKVVRISNPNAGFNYAYINNCAVSYTAGEYVLFLNDDTEMKEPKWLSRMVGYVGMEGIGAVGARLLYQDGRIQHAGIIHGYYNGMAGPANKLLPGWHNGYLSYAVVSRNYLAVTAACLLIEKKCFIEMGGFDENNFAVAYNDVDLCYRLRHSGLRCVYASGAELVHYEGYSRGYDDKPAEEAAFKKKYSSLVDPYYNRNLSLDNERFEINPVASECYPPGKAVRALMVAFNLNLEGAPYSQFELTVGLKKLGIVEPVVYCPDDGPLRALYTNEGIEVVVKAHPLRGIYDLSGYENAILSFKLFIEEMDVDIVYANTLQTFYAIEAANQAGLPSIWNPRESEPWQTYFNHFGNDIALKALKCFLYPYKVVFVSNATRVGCEELNVKNNFMTINNGLEPLRAKMEADRYAKKDSRRILGVGDDEIMVLLLGTVCERKGQLDLILAIERLGNAVLRNKAVFFIVGDRIGAYSTQLHRALDGLPHELSQRVHIINETKDTALYFSSADIFLCSSRVESYPRVILEAMFYGLAIISSPVFGIVEQLNDNINALFYNPGDVEKLSKNLECLLTSEETRKRISTNARYKLERLTSFDEMIKKYADVFIGAYYTGSR